MILKGFLHDFEIKTLASLGMATSHLWEPGRQGTGYERLALRSLVDGDPLYRAITRRALSYMGTPWENRWDVWLLRYPDGSGLPPHRDKAALASVRHQRLNVVVQAAKTGGGLVMGDHHVSLEVGDAIVFYPDQEEHAVTTVVGTRIVFSVGVWADFSGRALEPSH